RSPNDRCIRVSTKVTHACVQVNLAVRCDADQTVITACAGRVVALANTDTTHLVLADATGKILLLLPVEHLRGLVDSFRHVGAGDAPLTGTDRGVGTRSVGAAECDPIQACLVGSLVHNRSEYRGHLEIGRAHV